MNKSYIEIPGWDTTCLSTIDSVLDKLEFLNSRRWVTRGHSRCIGKLIPKIDRKPFDNIASRVRKIELECQVVESFQKKTPLVSAYEEKQNLHHDMNTLMLFQHFDGPTRLLDWSLNPYVAAFFSIFSDKNSNGEIWAFNYKKYKDLGHVQWEKIEKVHGIPINSPIEIKYDYAFSENRPNPDFFMCVFNYIAFTRMLVQDGLFTMTANFGIDHANAIKEYFGDDQKYCRRYIIVSKVKKELARVLKEDLKIYKESLFPDTSDIVKQIKVELANNL